MKWLQWWILRYVYFTTKFLEDTTPPGKMLSCIVPHTNLEEFESGQRPLSALCSSPPKNMFLPLATQLRLSTATLEGRSCVGIAGQGQNLTADSSTNFLSPGPLPSAVRMAREQNLFSASPHLGHCTLMKAGVNVSGLPGMPIQLAIGSNLLFFLPPNSKIDKSRRKT